MIPSVLTSQVRQGIEDFLRTTFPISTPLFHGLLERLFEEAEGIFKGPYLSIQLPFRQGEGGPDFFPDVPLKFKPYLHQEQAFKRLSGLHPHSTLVATGTGSGKTESFLFPILDYCRRHRGAHGVKALLIYPMNALATDQAGRLAREIWKNPNLKGQVTAGLFVGQQEDQPHLQMGSDHLITNRETMQKMPPDILLTNYKMLDYLLIRPRDYPLWQQNGPETLRYLVVDELHTFDGAQGSDLACLIRRLKARLQTPSNYLCCVGTSATLGGKNAGDALRGYAEEVFGETFDADSIITESRLHAGEFLEGSLITHTRVVPPAAQEVLRPDRYDTYADYLRAQVRHWFGREIPPAAFEEQAWRVDLGDQLKGHTFIRNLLTVLGGKVLAYDDILYELQQATAELREADEAYRQNLINSIIALISTARIWTPENDADRAQREAEGRERTTMPFLNARLQLWLRELRRMVCAIAPVPLLRFADDLKEAERARHLPVVHCRDCGSMGWAGLKRQEDHRFNADLKSFYIGFFNDAPTVTFIFPEEDAGRHQGMEGFSQQLCSECLSLSRPDQTTCSSCGSEGLVLVFIPNTRRKRGKKVVSEHDCPYCGSREGLTILGSRAASLTSVLIAQLFSSTFNDDKKLIAFSDSVQDASHRAGFFGARTFRFNFRSALQQFVLAEGKGMTLEELPDAFIRYWSDPSRMSPETYVAIFLAPNMAWFEDYEHLKQYGKIPVGSSLKHDVDSRVHWEILGEYAFRARIGRTLEKTGSSVAHLDTDRLSAATQALLEPLQNEIGELRDLDVQTLHQFLSGFLVHLKNGGGVLHPELKTYIGDMGNAFLLTRRPHLPNFGRQSRAPVFLTTRQGTRFDTLLSPRASTKTWSEAWAASVFRSINPLIDGSAPRLYAIVLKALVEHQILEERQVNGDEVWGIRPDALRITTEVTQLRCNKCGHNTSIAQQEKESWTGTPCLRFRCSGRYEEEPPREDYYGKLYASGDIERIFADEHTGLLKRNVREALEMAFMRKERYPWDPNLLSCTPTLEMGIDIGDLSSVILCSVPPSQANYLQRIGRAGRRDGNALNLTVANGRPHDLYFFAEPKEMIAGHVETPRIYLSASAVLERQFTAFCFDRWVESGVSLHAVPAIIGRVLDGLSPYAQDNFPHNLLHFIELNQTDLFDRFLALFDAALTSDAVEQLRTYVEGNDTDKGSLRYKILNALFALRAEQDALRKNVRSLRDKLKKKESDPAKGKGFDEEIDALQNERDALNKIVRKIRDTQTYNFFTDEGLLPNYAFPEAGVLLRSIIFRRRKDPQPGESKYIQQVYEYERPAVSAIHELAPYNRFYAEGRSVQVDQVNLEISPPEAWRFCDRCAYLEQAVGSNGKPACPRCGSTGWADIGQQQQMVRMRQVVASTSDRESRVGDDSDDRDPAFYTKEVLVDFEEHDITDAYRVEDEALPFGFEFLKKATLREVNFGQQGGNNSETILIAGKEVAQHGFELCKHCGKVQTHRQEDNHALWCSARDKDAASVRTEYLYLYREFSSEAIRILLPVGTFEGSVEKLHSFVAALQLGLKERFGRVDHLRTTIQGEPVPDAVYRKQYLVLYDTVPGGTGYLKQLMRETEPMMEVFERALGVLTSCACNKDPEKDGCYRCLYAYRNSYDMPSTSRKAATELLAEILEHRTQLVQVPNLRGVSINAVVESELEAMFIEALRRFGSESFPVTVRKDTVNGKPGWFLKLDQHAYYIEPQVFLGPDDGVSIPSRADFVLWPARDQKGIKPVALFTDGYRYHKDRIGLDLAQRMAIVQSGRFLTWSLTWRDVQNRFKPAGQYYHDFASVHHPSLAKYLQAYDGKFGTARLLKAQGEDSFAWLVRYLRDPRASTWGVFAFVHALLRLDTKRYAAEEGRAEWFSTVEDIIPDEPGALLHFEEPSFFGWHNPAVLDGQLTLHQFFRVKQAGVKTADIRAAHMVCLLPDEEAQRSLDDFEGVWTGFLRQYNLFQFLPNTCFVTREGLEAQAYEEIEWSAGLSPQVDLEAVWEELKDMTDEDIHPLLDLLAEKGWSPPIAGFELADEKGGVIADAELGWPDKKLAFLDDHQLDYAAVFAQQGWRTEALRSVIKDPSSFLK